MKTNPCLLGLFFFTLLMAHARAAELGSPEFMPSAERAFGWRGDGSGRFPAATPPLHWSRTAKAVKALRAQSGKPKTGDTGQPIADGVIHDWLVLGPLPQEEEQAAIKVDTLSPDENESVGKCSWKKAQTDSYTLDFGEVLGAGRPKQDLAFAHAYIYSETKVGIRLIKEIDLAMGTKNIKVFVNGVAAGGDFELQKGWNRLLLRVPCGQNLDKLVSWYVQPAMVGTPASEFAEENIAWTTRIPGWGIASPVIVGSKIFVGGHLRTLCCVDKANGKILWAHTATQYDAATEEEKKAHPEVFKEIAPLASRLAEIDKSFAEGKLSGALIGEKAGIESRVDDLMRTVDKEKYNNKQAAGAIGGDAGAAVRTPITDGKSIFYNYHPNLTVCYDLDGKQKWIQVVPNLHKGESHGWFCSTALVAGKVIAVADRTVAFDAETGKIIWESKESAMLPSAFGGTLEKQPVVFLGANILSANDGKVITTLGGTIATPVLNAGIMYSLRAGGGEPRFCNNEAIDVVRLEGAKPGISKTININVAKFFKMPRLEVNIASPLYDNGLLYVVDANGVLSVADAQSGETLYQKFLDLDNGPGGPSRGAQGASPTLAGKYVYIWGNLGTCVVIEAGRTYKPVAKNQLRYFCTGSEQEYSWQTLYSTGLEQSLSCPVFEGKRMYYRGVSNLYCVEEK